MTSQENVRAQTEEAATTAKSGLFSPLNILYLVALAIQIYAYFIHFRRPSSGTKSPGYIHLFKLLSATSAFATAWPTYIGGESISTTTLPLALISGLAYLASIVLFAWTAWTTSPPGRLSVIFGRVKPEYVITTGPYAYVRHPTYVSYGLAWSASIVMLLARGHMGDAWFYVAGTSFAGLVWLYLEAAKQEEAEFRVEAKGDEVMEKYQDYSARVKNRWVPAMG